MLVTDIETRLKTILPDTIDVNNFGIAFLDVFKAGFKGNARAKLVSGIDNHSQIDGGVLLKNHYHYAPTLGDQSIDDILSVLSLAPETKKNKVRYLVTFDGVSVGARDVIEGDSLHCRIGDLIHEYQFFSPLYGESRYIARGEAKIDQDAALAMGKIYRALVGADPAWASQHPRDLNTFMTRMLFCLFAEDTGLFKEDIFTTTLRHRAASHPEVAQSVIQDIFRILNVPESRRKNEPEWLMKFPYVNGDVFALEDMMVPNFNHQAVHYLLDAGELINWSQVHADILGSSIQKIVEPGMRHALGMHYTSVSNIEKVLGPLFLDDLQQARMHAKSLSNPGRALNALLDRVSMIKIFDPACGSGNFLVVAYKKLRELEIQILEDLSVAGQAQVEAFSRITLENFYGIEYTDFAAETAKVSLRIVEHQMDMLYGQRFHRPEVCLPLREAPNIYTGSALTVDWETVCPSRRHDEVYICGNPPYLGSGSRSQEQHDEQDGVMKKRIPSGGRILDYVCNWFVLAHDFCATRKTSRFAFVTTNSICQGVHVPNLWPYLFSKGMEISFAYTSFKWSNLAGNNAGVTCVIVGMQHKSEGLKRIFTGSEELKSKNINAYLMDSPNVWIEAASKPISNSLPFMTKGNQPTDGGHLHLTPDEAEALIAKYPESKVLIRRLVGSQEMLKGIERFCLWITDELLPLAQSIPEVAKRIELVRNMRLSSKKLATVKSAENSCRFDEIRHEENSKMTIAVPQISSEKREYLPVSPVEQGSIVNNRCFMILNAENYHISILSSKMHYVWLANIGGRMGAANDLSYSNTLVWYTFPMPELAETQKLALNQSARNILLARELQPDLTLGDMYNPENMGPALLKAHHDNDRLIEQLFRDKPFKSDEDRLAHLFERYNAMIKQEAQA